MTQAVLTISGSTFFTSSLKHQSRVFVHWLLQTIAGILITIAVVAIFINKIYQERQHFQSIHAIFGLIAYGLTLASIVSGVFTKYSVRFRSIMPLVYRKLVHVVLGIVAYTLSIVATMLGFYSPWFTKNSNPTIRVTLVGTLCVTTLYILFQPLKRVTSRLKGVLKSDNL
jgi:cytochrome b-561 domain containing protein 2